MTCLSIVQDVCMQLGITVPNAVATSNDPQVLQLFGLLNKEGRALRDRPDEGWQVLQLEATFTTVATESQGLMSVIAPNYRYILNNTIWNRSNRRPVFGPLTPQQWQMQKGWFAQGPYSQYRLVGDAILFTPIPSAGDECYFEYGTNNWATDSTGLTGKTGFTADDDLSLLNEELLKLGLMWRWKQVKGLDYAEDKIEYEDRVNQAMARDTPRPNLNLSRNNYQLPPLYVQDGDYPAGN
jgi:hypothetical protein